MTSRWRADAGTTLAEVLVSITLLAVLASVLASTVSGAGKGLETTRATVDLAQEARHTLNRLSTELRESQGLDAVKLTGGEVTAFSFAVDFSGDGLISDDVTDPERITYCLKPGGVPGAGELLLAPGVSNATCASPNSLPILAGQVDEFDVQLLSSYAKCESDGDPSSRSWQELDAVGCTGVGNGNGKPDAELALIDHVRLHLKLLRGTRTQNYQVDVSLRNRLAAAGVAP